jgi:hypothetical protein
MVGALSSWNRIQYMTEMTKDEAEYWFDINKVVDYDLLIDSSVGLEGEDLAERQIKYARARGPIELFITNNPKHWVFAFDQGIPSVLFAVPAYTRLEFRPDAPKKIRTWDEIEEAVKTQNQVRTKDARLLRTESLNFE